MKKYICASCKTIYDESEINIDPMSSVQICPKCRRVTGIYSEEELTSKINDYIELFQILNKSTENE